jgi:hypothetical protein
VETMAINSGKYWGKNLFEGAGNAAMLTKK